MTNKEQADHQPKISRRDFLKAAVVGGGSLLAGGLLDACTKAGAQVLAPTSMPKPTEPPTNTPFPSPTATISATETRKPTETPIPPKQVTITADLLTSGLTGIGGADEKAPIPIPTSTPGGETRKDVPFIDTYGYSQNAWLWDGKSKATDIATDPIKALEYFIALTEMSVVEGGIDFQKLFPQLSSPLVFEKMTVSALPGGNTISAKINAQPQGLEINKMTHMIVVGRYTDVSAGNQVIVAFDDFNRSKIASPRLTLAVLPETTDPSTNAVTSFQDMLKQNGWDYDRVKGAITLPKGKQLLINQVDNVTGQSFANQISDAAGALYVNKRPDGGVYFNPVVPYPSQALRTKAVSGYTVQNGQPVGLDLKNNPVAQASYDAGSDTWAWKEVVVEDNSLGGIAEKIKIDGTPLLMGFTVSRGDSGYTTSTYRDAVVNNASLIVDPEGLNPDHIGRSNFDYWIKLAANNEKTYRYQQAFSPTLFADLPKTMTVVEAQKYMDERNRNILKEIFNPSLNKSLKNPQIVLANEPFWRYIDQTGSYRGWFGDPSTDSNGLYSAFGTKWIAKAFVSLYNIAKNEFNLTLGKDFTVIGINTAGIQTPGAQAEFEIQQIQNTVQAAANELGLSYKAVANMFGVGKEDHLRKTPPNMGIFLSRDQINKLTLINHYKSVSNRIGCWLHTTEKDCDDASLAQELFPVMTAADVESGVVKTINYWATFSHNGAWQNPLLTPTMTLSPVYDAEVKALKQYVHS